MPPDYKSIERAFFSPASAQQYAALSKSASNLLAVVDDMLRSPTPSATLCSKKAVPIHKPLPSRPRSMSLPSTPEPVELPGSILLENQGFPSPPPVAGSTWNTMRSVRSGNALGSSTIARPVPAQVPPQKKNLGETSLQRRSRVRPNLVTTPSTDSNLTTCSVSTANGDQTSSASSSKIRVGVDPALQRSSLTVDGEPRRNASGASTAHRDDVSFVHSYAPFPRLSDKRMSRAPCQRLFRSLCPCSTDPPALPLRGPEKRNSRCDGAQQRWVFPCLVPDSRLVSSDRSAST